jgi:hypothetical protein
VNNNTGVRTDLSSVTGIGPFALPANPGPRTMDYEALFGQATFTLDQGIRVFAGTVDDPFWIDLGGVFDTFNTHAPPVLTPTQDGAQANIAPDAISGFAVNSIALEVPVTLLTQTGNLEPPDSPAATIGVWATTSRPRITIRRSPLPAIGGGTFAQVQRMGNPLINELLVGTGYKDRFSMDLPRNDSQFTTFFLDPTLARGVNALTGGSVAIPSPPRNDLLPLVQYAPPIAAPGTPAGPIADLLRLNTGVPPTPLANASRLGLLGNDPAGFPNGRRLVDDVTDIALRLVVGGVLAAPFPGYIEGVNDRLGDGVNVNDTYYHATFPYLGLAPSGRDRRHVDPGETNGGTPTIVFQGLGSNPFGTPLSAVVWRVRNPDIGHIDGPFSLPGSAVSGYPVGEPCSIGPVCPSTTLGGTWADIDICPYIHLHGPFQGHGDPAPGPPTTTSACGHGALEWGYLAP